MRGPSSRTFRGNAAVLGLSGLCVFASFWVQGEGGNNRVRSHMYTAYVRRDKRHTPFIPLIKGSYGAWCMVHGAYGKTCAVHYQGKHANVESRTDDELYEADAE